MGRRGSAVLFDLISAFFHEASASIIISTMSLNIMTSLISDVYSEVEKHGIKVYSLTSATSTVLAIWGCSLHCS